MDFTIEEFVYEKHMQRLLLLELSPASLGELKGTDLSKDLGFTPHQVTMDHILGSESCWVFLHKQSRRVVGLAGAAQAIRGGTIVVTPWFLSSGFHTSPQNVRAFLRCVRELLRGWEMSARQREFILECSNTRQNNRFLRFLGFTAVSMGKERVTFRKKGVTHARSTNGPHTSGQHPCPNTGGNQTTNK